MNFISNVLSVVFGIALLALLGAGIYYAFHYLTETLFASLDPQLAAITAIAATTFLIASFVIASALRRSQKNTDPFSIDKRVVYEHFIRIWGKLFWQIPQQQSEIDAGEVQEFEKQLILLANPKVIQAYLTLRQFEMKPGFSDPKIKAQFIKVLMEIRKDLGLTNLGLEEQELLKLSDSVPDHPDRTRSAE